ncbi:nucleotidyltransferase domain-containing protein [Cohnella thailandensis]|uniref:Nucleotidyltransferase domain-containing protein n=1 Tax=Cohnella thailandensis TaxID=557557 RepID=A0A841STR0_9BACL|nr:nucleotidyltransferase domain-containing protein [Cohnella thailandensis]MBB6634622.1 nucleotidyltransferase domain-containing protein [Cohnella thailandensis]MBP1972822.1 putative nucleotidyltransferase [Cohnella thailandensis]
MHEHHRRALEALAEEIKQDPDVLALVTAGSVAQGRARESSDVDVFLILKDEAYERRKNSNDLSYLNREICDYEGGYIDGKMVNVRFLELAAERGSEPTRNAFVGSKVVYSQLEGLQSLIDRIPVYPEENRERNLRDFYAQIYLYGYYFSNEAAQKGNVYLLHHSATQLVLFGGRIILAHNRLLFPCHKDLMKAEKQAPYKPEGFAEQAEVLLKEPTVDKCMSFAAMLLGFRDPGIPFEQAVSLFVDNNEWNWLEHEPPLTDR